MSVSSGAHARAQVPLIIGFLDLSRFGAVAQRLDDAGLADTLDEFYRLVGAEVASSGGEVVKFLGDGALLTWPEDRADAALAAMLALRDRVDQWANARRLDTSLVVRLHSGTVVAGDFGPESRRHRDVIGKAVFVAARLDAKTLSVSAEAFRKLSPGARQLLKKHTPPVVYVPVADPRP
jgi:class 3 adenylate cyclase